MPHTNSGAHCTFLVSAKDGVPYEEFETEYKKHMVKATPILKKYGATYYSIVSRVLVVGSYRTPCAYLTWS